MPSTRRKIAIARLLSRIVLSARAGLGLPPTLETRRGGIRWKLDLAEGIDLSIWLLGGFEPRTLRDYRRLVRPGDVVLDIGANVGSHTLPLAQLVGATGRVLAFEPTAWAFAKQRVNIALNPDLEARIKTFQIMLASRDDGAPPDAVYSSWPLDEQEGLHHDHGGRMMSTVGCRQRSLDAFMAEIGASGVALIKLDVDGHELQVLEGAKSLLDRDRPRILLELAPYVHASNPAEFDSLVRFLHDAGYGLQSVRTGTPLPADPASLRDRIPPGGGMNVLAVPVAARSPAIHA
jgi:FkbM family methyltransferase